MSVSVRRFLSGTETDTDVRPLLPTYVHTDAVAHTHTHVVLPSTAKGSNENKWQSSIPAGT